VPQISVLTGLAGRLVVDCTGLTGAGDCDFEFAADPSPGAAAPHAATAVASRRSSSSLGLERPAQRGPVDVVVIDRVPPTEN